MIAVLTPELKDPKGLSGSEDEPEEKEAICCSLTPTP